MVAIVLLTAAMLIALFAGIAMVTWAIHREEHFWTLTRVAPGGCARLARSVCGVYMSGMGQEHALDLRLEDEAARYQYSGGPSWS
jgi:hypothetical protein